MQHLTQRIDTGAEVHDTLCLDYRTRTRTRFRAVLDSGAEVGVMLPRGGPPLRDGECLLSEAGTLCVGVRAAPETLSEVRCDEALAFARACYHLGNRHVPLQIESGRLCYVHDHVLDDMLVGLGHVVRTIEAPFHPESGAYGGGHAHAHHHD